MSISKATASRVKGLHSGWIRAAAPEMPAAQKRAEQPGDSGLSALPITNTS
jgi:hypothetical protein